MLYLLALVLTAAVIYLIWNNTAADRPIVNLEKEKLEDARPESKDKSTQLKSPADGHQQCPECGAEWWPDALKCWNCGYDTRAEDSGSSS